MIEIHGRERCGQVELAEMKTIARKNRLNDFQKKVKCIL